MRDPATDARIVLTLDAGGTNFVFAAVQGGQEIVEPLSLPAHGDDLEACLVLEDLADPGPNELVVVGEDDRDGLVCLGLGCHAGKVTRGDRDRGSAPSRRGPR